MLCRSVASEHELVASFQLNDNSICSFPHNSVGAFMAMRRKR